MMGSGFHVYFWRLQFLRWTLCKVDISIKRTLLSCTDGIHFLKIPLGLLKRVQPKILVLIINFFSLNFTKIEIEGERVSSSQNKRGRGTGYLGGQVEIYNEQIKSPDPLIKWSCKVTWNMLIVVSELLSLNLAKWWLTIRNFNPLIHINTWLCEIR